MRAKKIVNQSSDFPVSRTGSYRHKKALSRTDASSKIVIVVDLHVCTAGDDQFTPLDPTQQDGRVGQCE